ncbi:hypothetical protein ACFFV7_29975 [Nonomuraea spiralis]|uniref:MFS transporter n=1 Tax=Nonomuraea spiralis TaxID=46182 RepID=A0ABV5ILN5_9ACTN|nr:hypothetical protein [Nonomuraea spiralis]
MSDELGRHRLSSISADLEAGGTLLAFAAGSLACAPASSMPVLIAARAVQGVGGGGLVVTAISALAQMFTREELVRRQGHLTGVALFGTFAFIPLAIKEGTGAGSDETGLLLLALTTGQLAATTMFSVLARPDRRHHGRAHLRPAARRLDRCRRVRPAPAHRVGDTNRRDRRARVRRDLPGRRPGHRAPRQGRHPGDTGSRRSTCAHFAENGNLASGHEWPDGRVYVTVIKIDWVNAWTAPCNG